MHKFIYFTLALALFSPLRADEHYVYQQANIGTEKCHFKHIPKRKGANKRFILFQRASKAYIEEDLENPGNYILTLEKLEPYLAFYKIQPNKNFGVITMRQYMWYCTLGKSAFEKSKGGALGYFTVPIHKCKNKDDCFELFELNRPKYNKKANTLKYSVKPLCDHKVKLGKYKDVTLTIDLALN